MASVYIKSGIEVPVAVMAGKRGEMDGAAHRVKRAVLAEAAKHRLTGAYAAGIRVEKVPGVSGTGRQVTDRVVMSTDPGTIPIEFGYHRGVRTRDGRRVSTGRLEWVPGKHIMQNAMQAVR